MKSTIRLFALLLTCVLLFAACGGPAATAAPTSPEEAAATGDAAVTPAEEGATAPASKDMVTLEFLAPSPVSAVNGFDEVLKKFEEQTADTLGIKLNYVFTTFDDIGQKVSLKMTSGEQLDCAFVAQWTNPSAMQMVSKAMLKNLDPYFTSGEYPALTAAFPEEYLKNNAYADSNGEYHTYAIPFSQGFAGGGGIYYRMDLAKKFGLGPITSYEELTAYYDKVLENEPGMVPYAILGSVDMLSNNLRTFIEPPQTEKHNNFRYDNNIAAAVRPDGTAYVARHIVPELDPDYYALLNAPLNEIAPLSEYALAREWYTKGYVEKDVLSQKDHEGLFVAGRAASFPRNIDTYAMTEGRLKGSMPDAELGIFITDKGLMNKQDKLVGSDFKAWNFAAIPETSKYADRTMSFFNWLFEDSAHHDLFEYGVEGVHWNAEGEDRYAIPATLDSSQIYNFPGYILTWNPSMVRYEAALSDEIVNGLKTLGDTNFFYKRADAGFSFVTDSIKTEQAKINDLSSLMRAVGNGVIEDYEGEIAKIQKQFEQAGYFTITDTFSEQFNEFLKTNPYEGQ